MPSSVDPHSLTDRLHAEVHGHAPQAIIFDCDGTLAHSMPAHYVAWRNTLEPHGVEFLESKFYSLAGMPSDRIINLLSDEQGIELDADRLAEEKEERFLETLHLLEPIIPVVALAKTSAGKLPIAVASGGFREIIQHQLTQIEIRHLFEVIVTAEDTERHKPEPDVFLEAARQLAIDPTECCVLEDSDLGITAAKRAGMSWVDVRPYCPS